MPFPLIVLIFIITNFCFLKVFPVAILLVYLSGLFQRPNCLSVFLGVLHTEKHRMKLDI